MIVIKKLNFNFIWFKTFRPCDNYNFFFKKPGNGLSGARPAPAQRGRALLVLIFDLVSLFGDIILYYYSLLFNVWLTLNDLHWYDSVIIYWLQTFVDINCARTNSYSPYLASVKELNVGGHYYLYGNFWHSLWRRLHLRWKRSIILTY